MVKPERARAVEEHVMKQFKMSGGMNKITDYQLKALLENSSDQQPPKKNIIVRIIFKFLTIYL